MGEREHELRQRALARAGGAQLLVGEDAELAADAGHDLDHVVELLLGVHGAERAAQQRHAVHTKEQLDHMVEVMTGIGRQFGVLPDKQLRAASAR